ncbi:hypothetical protein TIFTF001_037455 [Ficus carica]|uniref:RNase H type-1 domain-containing protein n=1 Tax=Ficus carica TaxID=3494 RepID=A0AA88E639_FICCA|nr:hypothetical protein TIFTF001_037455 [Ficus carica]
MPKRGIHCSTLTNHYSTPKRGTHRSTSANHCSTSVLKEALFSVPFHHGDDKISSASDEPLPEWILMVDGASNIKGLGIIIYLRSSTEVVIEQSFSLIFKASNNETKHGALIAGLRLAKSLGA